MLTIEDLLWRAESAQPDESTTEGRADALFLAEKYDEAGALYEQIANPPRHVREKLAWCRYDTGPGYVGEVLGDLDGSTGLGQRLQAEAANKTADVRAMEQFATYVTSRAEPQAFACSRTIPRRARWPHGWTRRRRTAA